MTVTPEMASAIVDEFLTTAGAATLSGDFETFLSRIHLPQEFETYSGRVQIADRDAAQSMFNHIHKQFEKVGVTDFVRACVSAEFQDTDTISATYESRLMRGNFLLLEPYPCFATLRKIDGVWKLINSMYAVDDIDNLEVGPCEQAAKRGQNH